MKNNEVDRRAGFVDSLLNTNVSDAAVSVDSSVKNDSQISHVQEDKSYRSGGVNTNVESKFFFVPS